MKKLFYKILIFLVILIIAQIAIYELIVPKISEITRLDSFLAQNTSVLFFGDSVVAYADPIDTNRESIAGMLAKLNTQDSIGDVSRDGYLPVLYEAMMEHISHSNHKPKAIILPINLASLSLPWFMVPGEQFEKERFQLTVHPSFMGDFWRPLAILGIVKANTVSQKEFLDTPVYYGTKLLGTLFDFTKTKKFSSTTAEEMKSSYIVRYMSDLSIDSPTLEPLKRLVKLAVENNITVYSYITPINYQEGVRLIGNDFLDQNRHTIGVVCSLFEAQGFPCLNLAFSVASKDFQFPEGKASEHLKENGRMKVAQELYRLIK